MQKKLGWEKKCNENQTFHLLFCISVVAFLIESLFFFFVSLSRICFTESLFLFKFLNALLFERGVLLHLLLIWVKFPQKFTSSAFSIFFFWILSLLFFVIDGSNSNHHNATNLSFFCCPCVKNHGFYCRAHYLLCHTELLFVGAFNCPPLKWQN